MIEGDWVDGGVPAISPIVPGYEVTGTVAALGDGVTGFAICRMPINTTPQPKYPQRPRQANGDTSSAASARRRAKGV